MPDLATIPTRPGEKHGNGWNPIKEDIDMLVFTFTRNTSPTHDMLYVGGRDYLLTYSTLPYSRNDAGRVRTDKSRLGLSLEHGVDLDIQVSVYEGRAYLGLLCEELTLSMS